MPHTYESRTTHCSECGGSGVRMGCDREVECFDCGGQGSWDAACADCSEVKPISTDGVCEDCSAELTYEQFLTKYRAHERLLDLTVESLGGGRHRVAA